MHPDTAPGSRSTVAGTAASNSAAPNSAAPNSVGVGVGVGIGDIAENAGDRDASVDGVVRPNRRGRNLLARVAVVALWLGALSLIGVTVVWGRRMQRDAPEVFLGAAPLVGRSYRDGWDWRFSPALVVAAVVAAGVVASVWRGWFERVRLRTAIVSAAVAALGFAVALAATDGADGLRFGAADDTEYWASVRSLPPIGTFLRTFVERIGDYSVHLRGHPPGFAALLEALDRVGAGSVWVVVAISVLSTGVVVVGVLATVWVVAGETSVRRAAPLLVVAPYALWMVTSADAFYSALGATAVACLALATRAVGHEMIAWAVGGGLAYGVLLFMTYGAATFVLVPVVIVGPLVWRRASGRVVLVATAVAATLAVVAAFLAGGFWWLAGARATQHEYWAGSAQFRTWTYFGLSNIAVALIALGPATFAGLTRLRERSVWRIVVAGLAALAVSHVSGYNRGEVERIWLIFYPWIAVAGVGVAARRRVAATWVGIQAVGAIVLQAALVSKW